MVFAALINNIAWSLLLVGTSDMTCQRIEYQYEKERVAEKRRRRRLLRRKIRRDDRPADDDGVEDVHASDDDSDDDDDDERDQWKLAESIEPFAFDLSRVARLMVSFGPVTDTLIFFQYQFGNPVVCPIGTPLRAVKLALFDNFVFWPVLCILSVGISSITQDEVPAGKRFRADYCPVYWSGALMYFPPQLLIFQCVSQTYQMAALKAITFCYGVSASFLTNRRIVAEEGWSDGMQTPRSRGGGPGSRGTPYVSPNVGPTWAVPRESLKSPQLSSGGSLPCAGGSAGDAAPSD